MSHLDHLEIGTISFERCEGKMVLPASERVRLILAAASAYQPDVLVTSGHAVHSLHWLDRLAELHRQDETGTAIVTEVLRDGVHPYLEPHAMRQSPPTGRSIASSAALRPPQRDQ